MYMTRETFDKIKASHNTLVLVDSDVDEAMAFVQDLLEAEAEAIKAHEPSATTSIKRLNDAAYEVFSMLGDINLEEFGIK